MLKTITTSEFNNLFEYSSNEIKNKQNSPCIIEASAQWCGPCRVMKPILEEISNEYKDIIFYNFDVDDEYEIATLFEIRSIPSILFIPKEGATKMSVGAIPKDKLKKLIKEVFDM